MFEVLVFMFENYLAMHTLPEDKVMAQELAEAGFDKTDIEGAFKWYQEIKNVLDTDEKHYSHSDTAMRAFTNSERKKINVESLGFITFLQQAKVINDVERDLIIDRAMALKQPEIKIEEMRWIAMIALWKKGREKDYLFVEDAFFNPRGLTLQ
jgi:Smg protein